MNNKQLKASAIKIFNAGIRAVDPAVCVEKYLRLFHDRLQVGSMDYPLEQIEKIFVIGIGKASAAMAQVVENILGNRITQGLAIPFFQT